VFFGLADARHFRRGINHRRDGVVIHMAGFSRDVLDAGDGLVFGLVRQHRAFAYIADGPDARNARLVMRIGDDAAAPVQLHADGDEAEIFRVSLAADANQNDVRFDLRLGTALRGFERDGQAAGGFLHANHLGGKLKLHALLGEDALEVLPDLAIESRRDAVQEFDHRHFAAEPAPYRAKLEA